MAEQLADLIQIRRDTRVNWELVNPVLDLAEVGLVYELDEDNNWKVTDPQEFKVGDGITSWQDLPLQYSAKFKDVYLNGTKISSTEGGRLDLSSPWDSDPNNGGIRATGGSSTATGLNALAHGSQNAASGEYSHAEGASTAASNYASHAEGSSTRALGTGSHSEGSYTTASGNYSHAEGNHTTASGAYSHAEGSSSLASGDFSHAEGHRTTASSRYSHAEGYHTKASGGYSHAEGYYTTASGYASHAEGIATVALGNYEHAQGIGNESLNNQIFSIGVGEWDDQEEELIGRKNAVSVISAENSCSVYILGVGNYSGSTETGSPVESLSEVLSLDPLSPEEYAEIIGSSLHDYLIVTDHLGDTEYYNKVDEILNGADCSDCEEYVSKLMANARTRNREANFYGAGVFEHTGFLEYSGSLYEVWEPFDESPEESITGLIEVSNSKTLYELSRCTLESGYGGVGGTGGYSEFYVPFDYYLIPDKAEDYDSEGLATYGLALVGLVC